MGRRGPLHGLDGAAGDGAAVVETRHAGVDGREREWVPALHRTGRDGAAAVGVRRPDGGVAAAAQGTVHRGGGGDQRAGAVSGQGLGSTHHL